MALLDNDKFSFKLEKTKYKHQTKIIYLKAFVTLCIKMPKVNCAVIICSNSTYS